MVKGTQVADLITTLFSHNGMNYILCLFVIAEQTKDILEKSIFSQPWQLSSACLQVTELKVLRHCQLDLIANAFDQVPCLESNYTGNSQFVNEVCCLYINLDCKRPVLLEQNYTVFHKSGLLLHVFSSFLRVCYGI